MAQYLHIRCVVKTDRTNMTAFTRWVRSNQTEVVGN